MSNGANDQAQILQFAAFATMVVGILQCIQDDHMCL